MIPKTSSLSIPYLDPATKVSELTQYSKELADRLEWALGVAGVSERVIAMDPVNAKLSNHETRLVAAEKKVATAESKIAATDKNVSTLTGKVKAIETAQAAPTSSKPALAAQWTANALTAIKDARLGLVFIVIDATRSAAIPNGDVMATLPAGYRPASDITVTGSQSIGGAAGPLVATINSAGEVRLWPGTTANKRAAFSTFWAAA